MRHLPGRLLLALVAVGCLPGSARGAWLRQLSLNELLLRSDATILGHAVGQHASWQGTRIVTVTRVAVDELWHGQLGGVDAIDVVTLGGTVGELAQRVDEAGELPRYGRMVLHLRRLPNGEFAPVGMAQGVWAVATLWGDGGMVAAPKVHGQQAAGGPEQAGLRTAAVPASRARAWTVGSLRHEIGDWTQRQRAGGRSTAR